MHTGHDEFVADAFRALRLDGEGMHVYIHLEKVFPNLSNFDLLVM